MTMLTLVWWDDNLFIVISSDKGLCSGIHSSVSKATHHSINTGENGGSTDSPIVIVGDKAKAQLLHTLTSNFSVMTGRNRSSHLLHLACATYMLRCGQ